jgi:5'-3' exonuclease
VIRLLAVDGNSLAHRAWHSTRGEPGAERPGVVTAALATMIASTWRYGPYDALLIAFDDRINRRREDFPEYKAQRPATDPALRLALDALPDELRGAGVAVQISPGAEADDVLAATVDEVRVRTWSCDLLSGDRDLTALVGGRVRLLRPRQRFSDLAVEDAAAVRARYGVDPERYLDLAALRGDASDGLAGAPGIGPERAARLVRDHGSISAIYRALPDLPPRLAAMLREGRKAVERNVLLMTPLPRIEVDLDAVARSGAPLEALADTLQARGLAEAAGRIRRSLAARMPPVPPPPPVAP